MKYTISILKRAGISKGGRSGWSTEWMSMEESSVNKFLGILIEIRKTKRYSRHGFSTCFWRLISPSSSATCTFDLHRVTPMLRKRRRRLFVEPLETRRVLAIDASLIQDINIGGDSGPSGFVQYGSHVYFSADDGTAGVELWRSDGSTA